MPRILGKICRVFAMLAIAAMFLAPDMAAASWGLVDQLNLAPFVPYVLDAMMTVATGTYDFFVGKGDGIIYILIWAILAITLSLYLLKMYFPKIWVEFAGFTGGGDLASGKTDGMTIGTNMLKPALRAVLAAVVLLQLRPTYVTEWLVNPMLQFGAMYTTNITEIAVPGIDAIERPQCPAGVLSHEWISQESCDFLIQPVYVISHANNQVIKRGLQMVSRGILGLMTMMPRGGADFLNLITGLILITTFFACNAFMALLIIQGIFNMAMALTLYPFHVLAWVAKPANPDKWFDIWPPLSEIVKALQSLIITMIACAFILVINIAVIHALFGGGTSNFVLAAGGIATTNLSSVTDSMGFGAHSILWVSAILTYFLMLRIFEMTRKRLMEYVPSKSDDLYNTAKADATKIKNIVTGWLGFKK